MKKTELWKVVAPAHSKKEFESIIAREPYNLFYRIGERTKAEVGKIICFKSQEEAKIWSEDIDGSHILLKGFTQSNISSISSLPLVGYWRSADKEIKRWWKGKHVYSFGLIHCPIGTVGAKTFTPTEVVGGKND